MAFTPYSKRLRELAATLGDQVGLIVETPDATETYDFRACDERVDAFACGMLDAGVEAGGAVIVCGPNSSATVFAAAASWRLGAFSVVISARASAQDLAAYIEILGERYPRVTVVSDHLAPGAGAAHLPLDALHEGRCDRQIVDHNPVPARAIPSGGTTGRSKLIVDPAPVGYSDEPMLLSPLGFDEVDSILVYGPLYHTAGGNLLHLALAKGYRTVLMDRFDAMRAQHLVEKHAIEFLFAVPTHLQRWLNLGDGLRRDAFRTIRSMYHTAAYCPPALKERWLEFMGPERVWEAYSATEGTGATMIRGDEWLEHRGSVGRAMPFCELVILDDDQAPVPTGEIGFIYMRVAGAETVDDGRSVYMGVEGPRVTPDGFRTVGDMGRLDEEGYLYIADRRTDMIITGGANVFPAEVEAALRDHPGIADAAVVGVPDADWGRRVCAVVVPAEPESPPSAAALDAYMSGAVANYKRPKQYEFRDALPLTEVGKLNRRVLTEECTARYAAEAGDD